VPGENRLRASPQTLLPVTFMAQGNISPKCSSSLPYVLGNVVVAALTDDDCLLANEFYHDFYSTTIVGTQAVRFTMQSNVLNPYLLVADADGNILAEDDNGAGQGSFNSALTLIAGAGTLLLAPSSAFTYELGSYTFSSTLVSGNATGCQTIYVTPGIVSEQTLADSDCLLEGDPFFGDQFVIVLTAGVPVTIRMTSTELDTWVGLYASGSPNAVAFNDDISATNFNSELTYTPTETNYYLILTSSHLPEETGAYTFEILPQAPGAAVRAPGSSLLRGGAPRLKSAFTPRLLVRRK
jgi:serine protease Do